MKTPFTTHGSLHRILILAFAVALLFIGIGYANPLEELRDILTKDRSKKQNGLAPGTVVQPPQPELRPILQPIAQTTGNITVCNWTLLHTMTVLQNGDILYLVNTKHRQKARRLAGNITTPAGRTMFQMLLHAGTGIGIKAEYPAGYNCHATNLTTPALSITINRID